MKTMLPIALLSVLLFASCASRKYYTSPLFERQTAHHKTIAVLPAEIVFTGMQPKNLSPESIAAIEENESLLFQNSLYNSILRYANSKKYYTSVLVQDLATTQKLLEQHQVSLRESWKEDDKRLAQILGVDAVVRMRIQNKRYMSDAASMGIDMGRQVLARSGAYAKLPLPSISNKTADIIASCNIVSNNQTLWNDSYKGGADYNRPADAVVDDITDAFGRHFPYKKRNS
jgi:hypothetical protein